MLITLEKTLLAQLTQDESTWFNDELLTLENSTDVENDLLNASVIANRKISSTLSIPDEQFIHIENAEIVRILLIYAAVENIIKNLGGDSTEQQKLLKQYYRSGDESEKCALLKGLSLLDKNGTSVSTAINATRCNSLNEFSALALNNDYPADYFEELNFNQLVLKSLFMGLNISLINKLDNRLNENLSNMCFAYAIEQALADRVPPASLWLALKYEHLTQEHLAEFNHYLNHFYRADEQHKAIILDLMQSDTLPFTEFD
jgi:hypothetical protein